MNVTRKNRACRVVRVQPWRKSVGHDHTPSWLRYLRGIKARGTTPPYESMAEATKFEADPTTNTTTGPPHGSNGIIEASESAAKAAKARSRIRDKDAAVSASVKRRCVSTACIACRRRKSKVCRTPRAAATQDTESLHTITYQQLTSSLLPVRWQYSKLCCMCIGLWYRMHLRPELRPSA